MRLDYIKESPGGVKAFGDLYGYISESGLEDILIDLVYLGVSQINDCVYCLDIHARDLFKKNVTPAKRPLCKPGVRRNRCPLTEKELRWHGRSR